MNFSPPGDFGGSVRELGPVLVKRIMRTMMLVRRKWRRRKTTLVPTLVFSFRN